MGTDPEGRAPTPKVLIPSQRSPVRLLGIVEPLDYAKKNRRKSDKKPNVIKPVGRNRNLP